MSTSSKRLGHIEPRERKGAQTGRRYEYQYEQTAVASLELLDKNDHLCVYCDWQDDFVTEVGDSASSCYRFTQVKTKDGSQEPWKFRELFGMPWPKAPSKPPKKPKVYQVEHKAVFPHMLWHHDHFNGSCIATVFLTNCGIDPALTVFLTSVANATDAASIGGDSQRVFLELFASYAAAQPKLASTPDELFRRIRSLVIVAQAGNLANPTSALLEIGYRIAEVSEIQLNITREAPTIARQLITIIRNKAHFTATVVPATDDVLRKEKGVLVSDILPVLSLSLEGYEALRKGGDHRESIKTLSRLHRFCSRSEELTPYVAKICGFKAQWDAWRTTERHFLQTIDYLTLEEKARALVQAKVPLDELAKSADSVAQSFKQSLKTSTPLTWEHVLGLVFSLAAEGERL